jgi:peptidoglycan/LPS O-acetylase OafA/YrhL
MTLAPEAPVLDLPPAAAAPRPRLLGRARATIARDLDAPTTWPALDSLRGLAVAAVVVWHVYRLSGSSPGGAPFWRWPLATLRLSPDVFFALSGFLVIRSWHSVRTKASGSVRAMGEFWRRRARRILPAYWVSLVVLLVLVGRPVLQHPRHLFLFATLNEYVRFWLPQRVNVVYWTLSVEWHFYLLVPLIAFLKVRIGRWPVLAGTLFLSFMWWSHVPPMQLPQGFVFGHLDQFVVGAIAGELVVAHASGATHRIVRALRQPWLGVTIPLAMLAVGTYHGWRLHGGSRELALDPLLHPVYGILAAAAIVHLLTRSGPARLQHRSLRLLGLVSFSLYLWHWPILSHGMPWARRHEMLPAPIWVPLSAVAFVAIALLVATASYVLVERPFLAHGRASKAEPASAKADVAPIAPMGARGPAGRLRSWPSRRSSASRPSTASRSGGRPTRTRSSHRAS